MYFLSYPSDLRPLVGRVADRLSARAQDVWWDTKLIERGAPFASQLEEGLAKAKAYVVFIGATGIDRFWVRAEFDFALRRKAVDNTLAIVPVLVGQVDPGKLGFAGNFQALALPDSKAVDADLDQLVVDLLAFASPPPAFLMTDPFPGLAAFDEEQAPFYFGREESITVATGQLSKAKLAWLHITGTSGAGKSSLARAGIVPLFRRGALLAADWHVAVMRPGNDPLNNLADAVTRVLPNVTRQEAYARIAASPGGFIELVRDKRVLEPEHGFMLLVDQLEEPLRVPKGRRPSALRHFDAALHRALGDTDLPFCLVTTLRADFEAELKEGMPRLHEAQSAAAKLALGPLSGKQLRTAITEPARIAGLRFEPVTLIDTLINDVVQLPKTPNQIAEGALPLLGYVLRALYDRRDLQSGQMRESVYTKLGGLAGALSADADGVRKQLGQEEQAALSRMLRQMVRVPMPHEGEGKYTRRPVSRATLARAAAVPDFESVLAILTGADRRRALPRLVLGRGVDHFELAHEALIVRWDWLFTEVGDNLEKHRGWQRLEDAAQAWRLSGMDSSWLARGTQLRTFDEVDVPSDTAIDFLSASHTLERKPFFERHRWIVTGIVGLTVGVVGGTIMLVYEYKAMNERFDNAIALADRRGYPGVRDYVRGLLANREERVDLEKILGPAATALDQGPENGPDGHVLMEKDRPMLICSARCVHDDYEIADKARFDNCHAKCTTTLAAKPFDNERVAVAAVNLRSVAEEFCNSRSCKTEKHPGDCKYCMDDAMKGMLGQESEFNPQGCGGGGVGVGGAEAGGVPSLLGLLLWIGRRWRRRRLRTTNTVVNAAP